MLVAAVVVIVDQLTKWWALEALERGPCSEPGNCIDLILGVKFNLVFNTGAAFTSGSDYGPIFAVLAFFMTGLLLYLASKRPDRLGSTLFAVIAGGAAGNLIDRVFRADGGLFNGAVVDFIDVGWWPVFNVADSAIVIGVIGVLIVTAREPDPDAVEAEVAVPAPPPIVADGAAEETPDHAGDTEPGIGVDRPDPAASVDSSGTDADLGDTRG